MIIEDRDLPESREDMLRSCTDALAIMAVNEHADLADFRDCISTPIFDLYQILMASK